jgi:2-polyprenyl-6-hydroxyphenyl methylase/3-demethylubiquinone-9 3-methyltransferase
MSNVDAQELAKFSELAHRWWDPESEFRPLHQINPLRLDWIDGAGPLKGKRCSTSAAAAASWPKRWPPGAARDRASTWPPSRWAWRGCTRWNRVSNLDYREIAAEALAAEAPASFDVVTCMEMLEHVPDPSSVVQACARWSSRAAGSSSRPQPQPQVLPVRHRRRRVRAEAAAQGHARVRALHPAERTGALAATPAWSLVASQGMATTRLTQRYWLGDDTSVNYLWPAAGPA